MMVRFNIMRLAMIHIPFKSKLSIHVRKEKK